jgi:hypothetical protein
MDCLKVCIWHMVLDFEAVMRLTIRREGQLMESSLVVGMGGEYTPNICRRDHGATGTASRKSD